MKKAFILFTLALFCSLALNAQDARLAGVWKFHEYSGDKTDSWDKFIRIDIDGNDVFISLKTTGVIDGKKFQSRGEAENVIVNSDGSISFDHYFSKKEYDNQDHLYWTAWDHYKVKYKGGRLFVNVKLMGLGYDNNGHLIKDDRDRPGKDCVYYNEKDNW